MEELNEWNERYELMKERILTLKKDASSCGLYADYVGTMSGFLAQIFTVYETFQEKGREEVPLSFLEQYNESLYEDIIGTRYEKSFANPDVCCAAFGTALGQKLCFLTAELRSLIPSAYQLCLWDLTVFSELFVEIETLMEEYPAEEDKEVLCLEVQDALYAFERDYSMDIIGKRLRNQLDASMDFATKIIMQAEQKDERILYYYGEYVGENERKSFAFLNSLSQQERSDMAFTYTDGYREGFEIAGIDLSKKKTVNIRYNIGFEPMVFEAVKQFEALGLRPTIYPAATKSLDKNRHLKIGYTGTSPNKQYDYDHRFDNAIYLDKAFMKRRLEVLKNAYQEYESLCAGYAGPACIEIFGEQDFSPVKKDTALSLSKEQQQLQVKLQTEAAKITNQYLPHDQYSFTIIAYPVAEIGKQYEEIFAETVKVNTLDKKKYQKIQQYLIDALDQAEYVHVQGCGGNRTDINVMLHEKKNPEKETNFENCLADVNIPVGEVFTSPKLTGTNGVLHVSSVYLNDLDYKDLTLTFQDGMVQSYQCSNFETEEENLVFVKENLLNHRETLPIGEFAIGTNTTAYVMARKYGILHKLPILIVEKMGPHFAVGDTCYSHSEEVRLFNPDGKEIVAKENECSLLRFEDEDRAYFNIHTDITIPYEEIGVIEAVRPDGSKIELLKEGHFVLPGTEDLNLKEMDE